MPRPARQSIALALLVSAFAAIAHAQTAPPGPATLSAHQRLAHEVYKQLVETNTVDSVGSVTTAVEAMAARFRAAGFPAADVRVLIPDGMPTKGNLVVRLHGRGGAQARKPILLLAHLDVVAAKRSDWPRDPFTLYEKNGYFLGRGTSDDKAMASIFVANLLRMKAEGYVPDRDIILALTADEEGGAANGASFLVTQHKDLIDAAYAINEGGGGTLVDDKPLFHSVQATEKVYVDFTLTATNTGGHSSVPRPDNAIYQLSHALLNVSHFQFPVELNEITKGFFAQTAKVEPRAEIATAMRAIVANPMDASANAVLSKDARYSSMLRTSCVATRLAGGHANNALPQSATANVNCRVAPTSNGNDVRAALVRAVSDTGVHVDFLTTVQKFGRTPTPIDPQLLGAITDLTARMWGNIPVIPTMSTGATDGAYLRADGIPTYGVSGLFMQPGEGNAHGRDEKMRVKSYYEGLDFLDQLVRQVTSAPRP
ncbi:MAG: M20/M25/M40 family metallo-hydrolase [Gemmatimonadota bacterium]|nr:M20/M25/M40 family metallo-hydrolase [Gemmatimonadota bacterium]